MNDNTLMNFYTLQSDSLKIVISSYGARLVSVVHQGCELIHGPRTPEGLLADESHAGAICGRVANRIAKGQCLIFGKEYNFPINNAENHLHGGPEGFSLQEWSLVQASKDEVTLSYTSPDGEGGYPGTLTVQATYKLDGNKISLCSKASCDQDTLVNLTNHAYWNLRGEGDICEHSLEIFASHYTPMMANIPTGEIVVAEGAFALIEGKCLGDVIGEGKDLPEGYDDNYCLLPTDGHVATLSVPERRLKIYTDAVGMQVYTGYYLPSRFGGIALEPQSYPDAPHQSHFPSIELAAGASYEQNITWQIEA